MRHPSECFIKSLMVSGKADDEVREIILEYGLPELTSDYTEYLLSLRTGVVAVTPSGYTGSRAQDRTFLQDHQMDGLIHPDPTVAGVVTLLQSPYTRRELFLGILGRVAAEDLAEHLTHKFGVKASAVQVKAAKHYYFDVDIVPPEDWFEIFSRITNEQESQGYYACLTGGPVVASYRLGIERHVTLKEAVNEVVSALYTTLYEIKEWPASPAKLKMLSDTMGALAKAHTVLNTSDQELAAVASELRTFKLSKNMSKPPPLALLAKKKGALKHETVRD
jgi:hypothetical protein